MAAQSLFPVFDLPKVAAPAAAQERKYHPSICFDFDTGDFLRDGAGKLVQCDGREAYRQWCQKTAMTERFTHLAYTAGIGTEMVEAMAQDDRAAVESAVERTINEALMVNPKTEYVRRFTFEWRADTLTCDFVVKGQDWEELSISLSIKQ